MNKQKSFLIGGIAFPILILLALVIYRIIQLHSYPGVVVPIVAYDPRAFLTGNYLVFNLTDEKKNTSFMCPKSISYLEKAIGCWTYTNTGWQVSVLDPAKSNSSQCSLAMEGRCGNGFFIAKPMKFYIPEQYTSELNKAVIANRASVGLLIKSKSNLQPTKLFIDGKPWEEVIIQQK
jgi:hypothetical protein